MSRSMFLIKPIPVSTPVICYNSADMSELQKYTELEQEFEETEEKGVGKQIFWILGGALILGLLITGLVLLLQPGTDTGRIRDIFIIFMALEFLLIGLVMVVLIAQLARLTHLLQTEIKPILDSSRETANTLKGTTAFLSENLVEPVIKLNEYLAGFNRVIKFIRPDKKK